MEHIEKKIKKLYEYYEWDFSTQYGFYLTFNLLIKPYYMDYKTFKDKLKLNEEEEYTMNGESEVLRNHLLDKLLKDVDENDFKLKK